MMVSFPHSHDPRSDCLHRRRPRLDQASLLSPHYHPFFAFTPRQLAPYFIIAAAAAAASAPAAAAGALGGSVAEVGDAGGASGDGGGPHPFPFSGNPNHATRRQIRGCDLQPSATARARALQRFHSESGLLAVESQVCPAGDRDVAAAHVNILALESRHVAATDAHVHPLLGLRVYPVCVVCLACWRDRNDHCRLCVVFDHRGEANAGSNAAQTNAKPQISEHAFVAGHLREDEQLDRVAG
jgi:hypothetical protein